MDVGVDSCACQAAGWSAHQVDGSNFAQEGEDAAAALAGEGNWLGELWGGFAELA